MYTNTQAMVFHNLDDITRSIKRRQLDEITRDKEPLRIIRQFNRALFANTRLKLNDVLEYFESPELYCVRYTGSDRMDFCVFDGESGYQWRWAFKDRLYTFDNETGGNIVRALNYNRYELHKKERCSLIFGCWGLQDTLIHDVICCIMRS